MPAQRKPKFDQVLNGVRVRIYATRSEYEALIGDGDIADPDAPVWLYPKVGDPGAWAAQARLDHGQDTAPVPGSGQ